ncbi:hypothetical protein ACIGEZ_05140 [Streptomyces sp. NPDC085481]|uniref:hypothetical protein n=1 Tax=Streptomyces sp. NPDC085481 TaxID=3365727 RepID=UPI0037D4FDF9
MRLRKALALAALTTGATVPVAHALAAPGLAAAPFPVPAVRAPAPSCGQEDAPDFPLGTRIHGGPEAYTAGADFRTWNLDLTNTTAEPCRGIHPVLVLVDRERTLRPAQIRAEFFDAAAGLWRPVAFEGTEQAESVGVFSAAPAAPSASAAPGASPQPPPAPAFPGFAVPAGGTLTVPVRLAFSADTAPDEVTVNAAVVQRRGDDGDWVGESGDYLLTVGPADPDTAPDTDPPPTTTPPKDPARPTAPSATPGPSLPELAGTGADTGADWGDGPGAGGAAGPGAGAGRGPGAGATAGPAPDTRADPGPGAEADTRARTGRETALRLAPLSAALLLAGAALLYVARRRRRHP